MSESGEDGVVVSESFCSDCLAGVSESARYCWRCGGTNIRKKEISVESSLLKAFPSCLRVVHFHSCKQ